VNYSETFTRQKRTGGFVCRSVIFIAAIQGKPLLISGSKLEIMLRIFLLVKNNDRKVLGEQKNEKAALNRKRTTSWETSIPKSI